MSAETNNKNSGHLFIGPFLLCYCVYNTAFLLDLIKASVHTDERQKLEAHNSLTEHILQQGAACRAATKDSARSQKSGPELNSARQKLGDLGDSLHPFLQRTR